MLDGFFLDHIPRCCPSDLFGNFGQVAVHSPDIWLGFCPCRYRIAEPFRLRQLSTVIRCDRLRDSTRSIQRSFENLHDCWRSSAKLQTTTSLKLTNRLYRAASTCPLVNPCYGIKDRSVRLQGEKRGIPRQCREDIWVGHNQTQRCLLGSFSYRDIFHTRWRWVFNPFRPVSC